MQKETIIKLREQAENNCRIYFDQLSTLQQQATQLAATLEQERGRVRAFADLEQSWKDPLPEQTMDFTPAGGIPDIPAKNSFIPVPQTQKSKIKEKQQ